MTNIQLCEICGEPMPAGEEMFKFHGYSGDCPKPPLSRPMKPTYEQLEAELAALKEALNAEYQRGRRAGITSVYDAMMVDNDKREGK